MKKIVAIFLCFLLVPTTAKAHQGIFIQEPISSIEESYLIPDFEESKAIYSELTEYGDIEFYRFEGEQGERLYTQILVPDIEGNRELLLTLVVFGPFDEGTALSQYEDAFSGLYRGYVIQPGNNRKSFFEPFTQTSYYKKQQFSMELPSDGLYYLAVYSPVEQTGKYVLSVGHEEQLSLQDLWQYPITWFRVNYWFNPLRPFSILFLVGLVIFAIVKLLVKRKKKRRFY